MVEKEGGDVQLSVKNVTNIAHSATSNQRLSTDAAIRVALEEEKRMQEVFRLAENVAQLAGRKTVKEEDIRMVYQFMESEL